MNSEDNEIKMPENAPNEAIIINDSMVTMGVFSVSIKKEVTDKGNINVVLDGVLKVPYYEQNIEKLESRRYIIKDIDVIEEYYSSDSEDIVYKFTCGYFRAKYQTELCDPLEKVLNYSALKGKTDDKQAD